MCLLRIMIMGMLLFSISSVAEPNEFRRRPGRGNFQPPRSAMEQLVKSMKLSVKQKKALMELKKKFGKNRENLPQKLRQNKRNLRQALENDEKEETLLKLFEKGAELRQNLEMERFRRVLEIRRILTPEQRKIFKGGRAHLRPPFPRRGPQRPRPMRGGENEF